MIELNAQLSRTGNPPRGISLHLPYGGAHNLRLTVQNDALEAIDLTGAAITMRVRPDVGQLPLYTVAFAGEQQAADGIVTATWALSSYMYPGKYIYDVWGTLNGQATQIVAASSLVILNSTMVT